LIERANWQSRVEQATLITKIRAGEKGFVSWVIPRLEILSGIEKVGTSMDLG
jgi:hypothetical protein